MAACDRLGGVSVHGLRSSFRDWASERTTFSARSARWPWPTRSRTRSRRHTGAATFSRSAASSWMHGPSSARRPCRRRGSCRSAGRVVKHLVRGRPTYTTFAGSAPIRQRIGPEQDGCRRAQRTRGLGRHDAPKCRRQDRWSPETRRRAMHRRAAKSSVSAARRARNISAELLDEAKSAGTTGMGSLSHIGLNIKRGLRTLRRR